MNRTTFDRPPAMDRTTWPDFRDQVLEYVADAASLQPRSYPGYPSWPLPRCRPRPWPALEQTLWSRRTAQTLSTHLPSRRQLSRLLQFSHGVSANPGHGPTPSAGGLQALELYCVNFVDAWLPAGLYHYERAAHALAQLDRTGDRTTWQNKVASLNLFSGGALLWVVAGDSERVTSKYGGRGWRFLLLEAGHLMQNLCLMSQRLGWTTVPLGAYFENEIARAFALPADDAVLYVGVCGQPRA